MTALFAETVPADNESRTAISLSEIVVKPIVRVVQAPMLVILG